MSERKVNDLEKWDEIGRGGLKLLSGYSSVDSRSITVHRYGLGHEDSEVFAQAVLLHMALSERTIDQTWLLTKKKVLR